MTCHRLKKFSLRQANRSLKIKSDENSILYIHNFSDLYVEMFLHIAFIWQLMQPHPLQLLRKQIMEWVLNPKRENSEHKQNRDENKNFEISFACFRDPVLG